MRLVRKFRELELRSSLSDVHNLYTGTNEPEEIRGIQLQRFNDVWRRISRESPFYAKIRERGDLPDRFDNWEQFSKMFPIMNRAMLQKESGRVALSHTRPDYLRTTGGTTAEPLQLAAWRGEDRLTLRNTWYGRGWFGVTAEDRLFLLWGHSHLLGRGFSGALKSALRSLKDRCLGYERFSAYDLSEDRLRIAGERLLRIRPNYVLGYATALHQLALVNREKHQQFSRLGLKVVIASGESFPSPDSRELVANTFGCPVAVEYGAIETGTIAHEDPAGGLRVFWGSYYVEAIPSNEISGAYEVVVTALYPRLTPLIRYRVGDLISASPEHPGAGIVFERVIGRANDWIVLGDDEFVHSEAFDHIMRDIKTVQSFQVVQTADRAVKINYTSSDSLPDDVARLIMERLEKVDSRLCATQISRVHRIDATVAGKSRRVVSHLSKAVKSAP